MATGSLPLSEPPRTASDDLSKHFDIKGERLFELVPMLDNPMDIIQHQEPPWLQIFNALVFLCSNNMMATESSAYELLLVAISSGFLFKMKHLLSMRGPTVEILALHLLFASLSVEGSKGEEFLRFLLESGVSPGSIDPRGGRSALYQAVRLGNKDAVHLLLTFGADPDAKIEGTICVTNKTPLICALDVCHDSEIAKMLIDSGADPNAGYGKPLALAIREKDFNVMKQLLEVGANPKLLPAGGLLVMYYGIYHHDLSMVNMSLEAGVSSDLLVEDLQDEDFIFLKFEFEYHLTIRVLTPLQFAVLEGDVDIIKRLIDSGAALDSFIDPAILKKMDQSMPHFGLLTPLQMSIQDSKEEVTKILLDAGSTIDFRHPTTATALQLACHLPKGEQKKPKLIKALLRRGADINATPGVHAGRTAMQAAAESGDCELLKLLLSKGGCPFAFASVKNGTSIFQAAIKSGSDELVEYVFGELSRSDGSVHCNDGINYMVEAVYTGNTLLIQTLMRSWYLLGLHWPKEYILSAVKVAILKGMTHVAEFLDPGLSNIPQEDISAMICECIWSGHQRTFDLLMQRAGKPNLDCAQPGYPTPLWLALHEGKRYMAQRLIDAGANLNQKSLAICRRGCCCRRTLEMPLKHAIYRVDCRFIEILIDKGADINCLIDSEQTPLLFALKRRNYDATHLLLSKGADPNAVSRFGERTVLGLALDQDVSPSIVRSLISYGADVNRPSVWGTPLEQAAKAHLWKHISLERCQLLLAAGADANASTGSTALQLAVGSNNLELAKLLISSGANINAADTGMTALEEAARNNNTNLAKLLLEAGADVSLSSTGTSALQLAAKNDNLELAKLLIEAGADVNSLETRMTALESAVRANSTEMAKLLVDAGADMGTSSTGLTLLQLAITKNNVELVKLFLDDGFNIDSMPIDNTALRNSTSLENLEFIQYPIDPGANIDAKSFKHPTTALQYASKHGNIEIVKHFVANGASVDEEASSYYDATALGLAVANNHTQVAMFLIENGASIDKCPAIYGGNTLLQLAAKHGNHEIASCLVENGAAVNAAPTTKRGATALQFAAMIGNIKMAIFLINHGARVSAKGAEVDGRTALEGAAEHGRLDMVHLLLDNDEEPETIEERCRNAAQFAEAERHNVIARILRKYKRP